MSGAPLDRVTVVLHRTRTPENVGSTVRALANLGLRRLCLADPAGFDLTRARRIAAEAGPYLAQAEVAPSLDLVLDRFALVVATTGRPRADQPHVDPTEAAEAMIDAASAGIEVALLFGDEKQGLPRAVLDRAHLVSHVPTDRRAPSMNLAMAVLLHAWELARLARERGRPPAGAAGPPGEAPGGAEADPDAAPLAPADLARLRDRARALGLAAGYLNPQQPDRVLAELERLLVRARPTARDGRLLLALVRQLEWAVGHEPT